MSRSQGSCFHGDLKIISSVLPSFRKSLLLPRHWARKSFTSWFITDSIVVSFSLEHRRFLSSPKLCVIDFEKTLCKLLIYIRDVKGHSIGIAKNLIKYFLHQRRTHLHAHIISDFQGKITPSYLLVQKH